MSQNIRAGKCTGDLGRFPMPSVLQGKVLSSNTPMSQLMEGGKEL
jgi:hypothetical protein